MKYEALKMLITYGNALFVPKDIDFYAVSFHIYKSDLSFIYGINSICYPYQQYLLLMMYAHLTFIIEKCKHVPITHGLS